MQLQSMSDVVWNKLNVTLSTLNKSYTLVHLSVRPVDESQTQYELWYSQGTAPICTIEVRETERENFNRFVNAILASKLTVR